MMIPKSLYRKWLEITKNIPWFQEYIIGSDAFYGHWKLYNLGLIADLQLDTLPKFNMEPENDGFQKESPIPGCHFQVPC